MTTLEKDAVDEEDNVPQQAFEKSLTDSILDFKPFLTNHGAQVARKASTKEEKKWNTGSIAVDVYKNYAN